MVGRTTRPFFSRRAGTNFWVDGENALETMLAGRSRLHSGRLRSAMRFVSRESTTPPDVDWGVRFDPRGLWDGSRTFRASMKAHGGVAAMLSCSLVGCAVLGAAWFVPSEVVSDLEPPFTDLDLRLDDLNRFDLITRLIWWYAAPRNGHISLFSRESLARLGAKQGLNFGSLIPDPHVFWRGAPAWAGHLFKQE
jgi:hypothetical protein